MRLNLIDRDPTPEDRESERDAARPGVWAGESGADLRKLTQDETDALIRFELWLDAPTADKASVQAACGMQSTAPPQLEVSESKGSLMHFARCQRGGIDSDPLVRVLARRAWGDRDRQWFELRAVGSGSYALGNVVERPTRRR